MTKEEAIMCIETLKWDLGEYLEGKEFAALHMAIEALKEEPTGKWIDMNGAETFPSWQRYKCSVCGERADMSNYCPRCGSRMKGEKDE